MLSNLRHCTYLIILILCLYSTALSQPPPTLQCDDCVESGTLEGPYNVNVDIDTIVGGCNVKIQYYKRTCKGFTNVFITNYKMSGTNCSGLSDNTKTDRALSRMIYDEIISLPPYGSGDAPAYWRVRRPACWQKSQITSDTVSYTSCPSAECCDTYFKAAVGDCGKNISYIPMKDTTNCPTPTPPMQCFRSCGRDPLDAWHRD